VGAELLDGFAAVTGFRDDDHILFAGKDGGDSF
jgi:hypothetical protein